MTIASITLAASIFALIFGLVATVVSVKLGRSDLVRSSRTREEILEQELERLREEYEKQIADLRAELNKTNLTITTMQSWLVEKQLVINNLEKQVAIPRGTAPTPVPEADQQNKSVLLVCVGPDSMLGNDLAALRKASRDTIWIQRLLPATKARLKRTIDRHRGEADAIRFVHFAVHAGPDGIMLEDGIATGHWLSETLSGVEVVLIAGCSADKVGDLIGSVPYVITFSEDVNNEDATRFSQAFWVAIGLQRQDKLNVRAAYETALIQSPPSITESAELHI